MYRRLYFLLLVVRFYFAVQPSYIHPDEHFQGPEPMAGDAFGWQTHRTWEFTSSAPIRSIFPLWLVYAVPMQMLHWIKPGPEPPTPNTIFYALRILFFLASFVLEDWALQELIVNPRQRRTTMLLLGSSYVTWTYQTHTFSNSVETLVVLWSLVLIERIEKSKTTAWIASALLGAAGVLGVWNRLTFPAFVVLPAVRMVPHFLKCPISLCILLLFAASTASIAVYLDTLFYGPSILSIPLLHRWVIHPCITPLNNLLYNTATSNLASHGLHARYTHLLINLPQLLGPALPLLILERPRLNSNTILAPIGSLTVLSFFPHQEARFLIPLVPLLLTTVHPPRSEHWKRIFLAAWILFNTLYGALMGIYHQAGVVPAQHFLAASTSASSIVYWKTYPPPQWLLGAEEGQVQVLDLMGASVPRLLESLERMPCEDAFLVAPLSAVGLDPLVQQGTLREVWRTRRHLNLDDMEFGEDGIVGTLKRVVGRRGLGVWKVAKGRC